MSKVPAGLSAAPVAVRAAVVLSTLLAACGGVGGRGPSTAPPVAGVLATLPVGTPPTLLHNLEHNRVLHERVILLTVATRDVPYVSDEDRSELEPLGQGFYRLALRYGFMQEPDVPAEPDYDRSLQVETLLASGNPGMALWREHLFVLLSRSAVRATSFFKIPPQRVVEIGIQVEL